MSDRVKLAFHNVVRTEWIEFMVSHDYPEQVKEFVLKYYGTGLVECISRSFNNLDNMEFIFGDNSIMFDYMNGWKKPCGIVIYKVYLKDKFIRRIIETPTSLVSTGNYAMNDIFHKNKCFYVRSSILNELLKAAKLEHQWIEYQLTQ